MQTNNSKYIGTERLNMGFDLGRSLVDITVLGHEEHLQIENAQDAIQSFQSGQRHRLVAIHLRDPKVRSRHR